jgi:hypothetical protein
MELGINEQGRGIENPKRCGQQRGSIIASGLP